MCAPRPGGEAREEEGEKRNKQEQVGGGEILASGQLTGQLWMDPILCCLPKEQKSLLFCISKSSFISDMEFGPIAEQQRQRIITEEI